MLRSYINKLCWQLDTVVQEKLKLGVALGNTQWLVENFRIKTRKEEIKERAEMGNAFVVIKKAVGEACTNEAELESAWGGGWGGWLTRWPSPGCSVKRRAKSCGHRSPIPHSPPQGRQLLPGPDGIIARCRLV